jgi:hypothetical protein
VFLSSLKDGGESICRTEMRNVGQKTVIGRKEVVFPYFEVYGIL